MNNLKKIGSDTLNCIKISTIASISLSIIIAIIFTMIYKGNIIKILWAIRATLLILGSLIIAVGGLLILKKRNESEFKNQEQWQKKYKILTYKTVIIINGFGVVFYGILIDWILINYRIL